MTPRKPVSASHAHAGETMKRSDSPWLPNLDPAERRACLRALRLFVWFFCGTSPLTMQALERMGREGSVEAIEKVSVAFNRLPLRPRRNISAYTLNMMAAFERRRN